MRVTQDRYWVRWLMAVLCYLGKIKVAFYGLLHRTLWLIVVNEEALPITLLADDKSLKGGQEFSENSLCADMNSAGERCRWRRNREGSRAMWAWDDIGGEGGVEKWGGSLVAIDICPRTGTGVSMRAKPPHTLVIAQLDVRNPPAPLPYC